MALSSAKKNKARLKKKKQQSQAATNNSPRPNAQSGGPVNRPAKTDNSPESAAAQADAALDAAGTLPPEGGSRLARLAHLLKRVLQELDPNKPEGQDNNDDDNNDEDSGQTPLDARSQQKIIRVSQTLTAATAKAGQAQKVAQIGGEAVASATKSAAKLARKAPGDMTAQELRAAINQAQAAIDQDNVLLPADAGFLSRALMALKKALMELGGVQSENVLADKDALEKLVQQKLDVEATNPEKTQQILQQQAAVKRAVGGVQAAQQMVAGNRAARAEPIGDPDHPELRALKATDPAALDADGIAQGIVDIERAIKVGQAMVPEDASVLQRALAILKRALLALGGVEPNTIITNKEELLARVAQHRATKSSNENIAKVKQAVDDVKEAEAQVARKKLARGAGDYRGIHPLPAIKHSEIESLTEQQLRDGIAEVDKAITAGRVLPPEDASVLTRLLYRLKEILFDLGNINPQVYYQGLEQAKDRLREIESRRNAEQASGGEPENDSDNDNDAATTVSDVAAEQLNLSLEQLATARVAVDAVLREQQRLAGKFGEVMSDNTR